MMAWKSSAGLMKSDEQAATLREMWQPVWNMAKEYIDLLYEFENMVKGLELNEELHSEKQMALFFYFVCFRFR